MKYILSLFVVSAVTMLSFNTADQIEFYDFFKMAYSESFNGLDGLKDSTGEWPHKHNVQNFDQCELRYNKQKGVNEMVMSRWYTLADEWKKPMEDLEKTLSTMLPEWQYTKTINRNADGTRAVMFTYTSTERVERDKYPTVELDVVKHETGYELVIRLFEPVVKRK